MKQKQLLEVLHLQVSTLFVPASSLLQGWARGLGMDTVTLASPFLHIPTGKGTKGRASWPQCQEQALQNNLPRRPLTSTTGQNSLPSAKLCFFQDEASVTCCSESPAALSSGTASTRTCPPHEHPPVPAAAGTQGSSGACSHRSPAAHGCRTIGHLIPHTMATMRQSHTMAQPGGRRGGCAVPSAVPVPLPAPGTHLGHGSPAVPLPGRCVGRQHWLFTSDCSAQT